MARGSAERGPQDAAEEFRRDFLRRLDELKAAIDQNNELMAGLHELGNLIVLALQDAVQAGAGSGFLDVVQRLVRAMRGEA